MFSLSRAVPESRVFEADCSCSSFPRSLIPFDRFVPLCRTLLFAKFVLKVKPEGFPPACTSARVAVVLLVLWVIAGGCAPGTACCGTFVSCYCIRLVVSSSCPPVGQVVLGEVSFAPNLAPIAKVGVVAGGGVPNGKGQGLSVVYEGC